jgi:2-polyprenyl-6-methoxyphenol hydroxylase-like FAD-dependent oxidoreductase
MLRLGVNIICVDCGSGVIVSDKGESFQGDLIIGADGVKSVIRQEVRGRREEPSVYSGHSAFRSLYNIEELKADPELRVFVNEIKMEDWVGRDGRRCVYPLEIRELRPH